MICQFQQPRTGGNVLSNLIIKLLNCQWEKRYCKYIYIYTHTCRYLCLYMILTYICIYMYIDVYSHTSVPHKTPIVSFKNPTPDVLGARWSRCCVVKVPSERPWMPRYAKPWRWKRPKGWSRWRWNAHNGNNNR